MNHDHSSAATYPLCEFVSIERKKLEFLERKAAAFDFLVKDRHNELWSAEFYGRGKTALEAVESAMRSQENPKI